MEFSCSGASEMGRNENPILASLNAAGITLTLNSLADLDTSLSLLPNLPIAALNTRVEYS